MPFVVPTIHVPAGVNDLGVDQFWDYSGNPSTPAVQKYVLWLRKELELAQEWLSLQCPKPEGVSS